MKTNNIVKNAVEFLLFNYFGLTQEDGNNLETVLDSAIRRAYFDATNQGAFNTLFTEALFPDREAVGELRERVKDMSGIVKDAVKTLYFSNDRIDFDKWHKGICRELLLRYYHICDEIDKPKCKTNPEAYDHFSYGNAQKWINMTIKNLYVISGAYLAMGCTNNEAFFNAVAERSNEYHIPLDNIVLGAIYKQKLIDREKRYFVEKKGRKDPTYSIAYFDNKGTLWTYPWSKIPLPGVYNTFREEIENAIDEPPIEWECRNWIDRTKKIKALKGDLTTIDD